MGCASGSNRTMVGPEGNNTLLSSQEAGCAWRESVGRWPELNTVLPQMGWSTMDMEGAPKDLSCCFRAGSVRHKPSWRSLSLSHRAMGKEKSCPVCPAPPALLGCTYTDCSSVPLHVTPQSSGNISLFALRGNRRTNSNRKPLRREAPHNLRR